MGRRGWLRGLGVVGLAVVAASCQAARGTADPVADGDRGEVTSDPADIDLNVLDADEQGIPNFVVGRLGRLKLVPGATAEEIERAAYPALTAAAPMLRLNPEELALQRAFTDALGEQHLRFSHYKNGVPVLGGEVIVHVRDGEVIAINGSARGDLEAPVEAGIDLSTAIQATQQGQEPIDHLQISEHAPFAYQVGRDKLHLVYLVDVKGMQQDGQPVHDTVLVDALDGAILDRIHHIHTAKNRKVHNLNHGTSLPGPVARTEGQAPISEPIVDCTYDLSGWLYDCYKNLFGRDSIDGLGATLINSVHYSTNYIGAFWNGTQFVCGDGDGTTCGNLCCCFDVIAHEMTHAVTQNESNLTYSGESGGLNESISDVFSAVCEWYKDGMVVSADTWKIGEDCWTPGTPGDAIRYLNDPALDGTSADHYADYTSGMDVHYSSGISNLAFYLLSQGGAHPRGQAQCNMTGVGINKAAQIYYRANTVYLTASSNFAAARTAMIQAATDLYGAGSPEAARVGDAWACVGVGGGDTFCTHDKCSTGGALSAGTCGSCVASICGTDPYCCTTSWDSVCVGEVRTVCSSLKCTDSNGTCAHSPCATGGALATGCDSAKANCVASICAADAYCCTSGWDSRCVGEVTSVCGKNCN